MRRKYLFKKTLNGANGMEVSRVHCLTLVGNGCFRRRISVVLSIELFLWGLCFVGHTRSLWRRHQVQANIHIALHQASYMIFLVRIGAPATLMCNT